MERWRDFSLCWFTGEEISQIHWKHVCHHQINKSCGAGHWLGSVENSSFLDMMNAIPHLNGTVISQQVCFCLKRTARLFAAAYHGPKP